MREGIALVYMPQLRGGQQADNKTPLWVLKRLKELLEGQIQDLEIFTVKNPQHDHKDKMEELEARLQEVEARLATRGYTGQGGVQLEMDGDWSTEEEEEEEECSMEIPPELTKERQDYWETFFDKYTKMDAEYQKSPFSVFETGFDVLEKEFRLRVGTNLEEPAYNNIVMYLEDRATPDFIRTNAAQLEEFALFRIGISDYPQRIRALLNALKRPI